MEPNRSSKFLAVGPLKKMISHLLLSLSIFSFLFSYYSFCSSNSLLHLPNSNPLINLKYSLHALNKKYIFLICNALLVFLSKTSGLVRSSSGFDLNDMLQKRVGDGLLQTCNDLATKDEMVIHREGKGIVSMDSHDDEEFIHGSLVDEVMDRQEVVEEEAMSTEELNKKFEEFIRKTKEEIINEARQLVIFK